MPTDPLLQTILDRNARVEAEKAWEISLTRRMTIAVLTYLTATVFLWLMKQPNFILMSFIPAGGYVLSTLSLPWVKRWWIRRRS